MRHRLDSVFVGICISLLIISCDDPIKPISKPACTLCDTLNRTERIEDRISFASYWNYEESYLSGFDTSTQELVGPTYKLCNSEVLLGIADEQIIRWSGYLHSSCDSVFQYPLVEIKSFEAAPYCPKPLPELDFEPDLWNATWEIESIQTVDTLLYKPCELLTATWFDFMDPNEIATAWYIAVKTIVFFGEINADTLTFIQPGVGQPADGNGNARRIEDAFLTLILPFGSPIIYSIEESRLTLRNLETKTVVVLRAIDKGRN